MQELVANVERSVSRLEATVPVEIGDMKRSLEEVKSTVDGHYDEFEEHREASE
ncbi:hypothetical protein FVEG_15510 [Fusarium verticillioides 7600]|uniref:Uncharacterized protein n=1 Tax=Gibberella moniliformis (strain M3125 / FGSC 7600) TaxID=334819 RepID=W7LUM6_GIBM7|nr:hypothetical protein FVEG_15510 [Fusarium verticillioides 7600]EWG42903.1 hypothetical protein FVEG_15510 [Fusarium verticillioides 7600]